MSYGYITLGQLKAALFQRLQDTSAVFTLDPEASLYIIESLRTLNALSFIWNADQLLNFQPAPAAPWLPLDFPGSVRERTVTDTDLYTIMEYHLLEPPTGGTWTGTTQFNITNLSQALQFRRDELLQASAANVVRFLQVSPTTDVVSTLPDTLLQLRRVRWIPDPTQGFTPYALWREDVLTADAYGNSLSLTREEPESYYVTSTPPLEFNVTSIPPVTGQWDILALESGVPFAPPATSKIGLPDDWCWLAKWGALADILSNSPEGTDRLRAKYCLERYERGRKAMSALPWLLQASVAAVPTDTPSVQEMDAYAQDWEDTWPLSDPQIVVGGVDLVALAPFVLSTGPLVSSLLTVVGNAPIPANDAAKVQLSRDGVEAVLCYAQHLAQFKQGGTEFAATMPLYQQFEQYCAQVNSRYAALGIMREQMVLEGERGDELDPRSLDEDEEVKAIRKQARAWKEANV